MRLPVGIRPHVPNVSTRETARRLQRRARRTVGAEQQQPAPRHQIDQPPERQRHGVQVGVDVRVIELDVVDDAMSGRYFRNFAVLSKNALSYSSPSMTNSRPCPRR